MYRFLLFLFLLTTYYQSLKAEILTDGLRQIRENKFEEALITFEKTDSTKKEPVYLFQLTINKILIVLSFELTNLNLYNLWQTGISQTKKENKITYNQFLKRISIYNSKINDLAFKLLKLSDELLQNLQKEDIDFSVTFDVSQWEIQNLSNMVNNGLQLIDSEIEKLEEGKFLINYIGLLARVLNTEPLESKINTYYGKLNSSELLFIVGKRLLLAGISFKNELFIDKAEKCFFEALNRKKIGKSLFSEIKAELNKINDFKKNHGKKLCSKCKRIFFEDFSFCPFDGNKLMNTGENNGKVRK